MRLRKALISDLDDIMQVEKSSFILPIQEDRAVFEERIRLCPDLFLVFEDDGAGSGEKVLGYLSAEIMEKIPETRGELKLGHKPIPVKKSSILNSKSSPYIYISSFALLPQARGGGFGKKMWNMSLAYFQENFPTCNFLLLVNEVWQGAKHIYQTSGFETLRTFTDFFPTESTSFTAGILMVKNVAKSPILKKMDTENTEKFDYIVIGAGPAGLASAQYAARGGLKTLVLDLAGSGGQVAQISELENYPGIYPSQNGSDFMANMQAQAEAFGAQIKMLAVTAIDKKADDFFVTTKEAVFQSSYLCLATGAIHRNLGLPGEAKFTGRGVSYCAVCDGPFFRGKKIFVIGGGDSACSEAIYLSTISDDVSIIHRRDSFRAQKALVEKMLASGVKPIYDSVVKSIDGNTKVQSITIQNVKTGQDQTLPADGIFIFAGMLPQTKLVEMLEKDQAGYIKTNDTMETAIPGLFAVGDVRSKSFRQVVTAVSDGAIAAHRACELKLK